MFRFKKPRKKFINPHTKRIKRHLLHFIFWKMGLYNDPYHLPIEMPKHFSYPFDKPFFPERPSLVWINHSTFLIEYEDISILTDPIWSKSPFPFLGPTRKHPPGIRLEDLPPIDFVMLSHDHYDHLDKKTIIRLHKKNPGIRWIVPKKVAKKFHKMKIPRVTELAWHEKISFGKKNATMAITAVPAQHFSGRYFFDLNRTLWNGYVTEITHEKGKKTFDFVGDTGYNEHDFKEVGKRFSLDLALIPIGSFMPERFMEAVHVNPEQAVKIHQDIKSPFSIAMHYKTFALSNESPEYPPYALYLAMQAKGIPFEEFSAILPGKYVNW